MDSWSTSSNDSGHVHSTIHNPRILASISGNVQSYAPDPKQQLDYKPYLQATRAVSEPKYRVPCVTLGSNDRQPLNNRLALHKARRSSQPINKVLRERPYLKNEKYLDYRKRKRQDLGKDNKPIWPDHVEASFQNALVNIPPLGRKKRTQRGKLLGRNELIREWILQETGEDRDRKQISSHIQVLGNVFKGVPEWKLVTSRVGEDDDENVNHGSDYYHGSIADKVRIWKELASSNTFDYDDADAEDYMTSMSTSSTIRRMTFEMWVGMPEKVFTSLHNYTCISELNRPSPTIELERYENWETLFPDLKGILEEDQVDVVLLKSRFNLMSDYPPATSKLVLDLDLDFRDFSSDRSASSWMRYFTSVNHLYHNGKKMRRTEHKDSLAVEPGVVKPFFEAEWWATQFTKVTRKMKEAEEAKDLDAIAAAEEYSRSLFRGLTIMQEIFVSPQHSESMTSQSPRKRVAVLLWVFAQTSKGNAGTTTWQHVTVQSSCVPQAQVPVGDNTCLPLLSMDVSVDDPFSIDLAGNEFNLDTNVPVSPIPYEVGAYHSGFTPYHPSANLHTSFDLDTVTGFTPRTDSFTEVKPDPMNFMMPLNTIPPFMPSEDIPDDKIALFTLPTQPLYENFSGPGPATDDTPELLPAELLQRRNTLAHFDMSTHDMLQAQLGDFRDNATAIFDSTQSSHDIDLIDVDSLSHESSQELHELDLSLANPDPESQQSMIGHMDSLELDEASLTQALISNNSPATPTMIQQKLMLEHPTIFESPKLPRPPLLPHNSFAGVLPDSDDEPLHFDTPTRNEFARVISGHLDRDDDLFGNDHVMDGFVMVEATGSGFEMARPRSQPVLRSSEIGLGYSRSDLISLDTPT